MIQLSIYIYIDQHFDNTVRPRNWGKAIAAPPPPRMSKLICWA